MEKIGEILGSIRVDAEDRLRPIPTEYRGVKFRSRLEARWAVFFTHVGIDWIYEFEGFDLPAGFYVPEFYLPQIETWIEVKPTAPLAGDRADRLLHDLSVAVSQAVGHRVVLVFGMPQEGDGAIQYAPFWDEIYGFARCPACGNIAITYRSLGDRVCGGRCSVPARTPGWTTALTRAAEAARTESFWQPD